MRKGKQRVRGGQPVDAPIQQIALSVLFGSVGATQASSQMLFSKGHILRFRHDYIPRLNFGFTLFVVYIRLWLGVIFDCLFFRPWLLQALRQQSSPRASSD